MVDDTTNICNIPPSLSVCCSLGNQKLNLLALMQSTVKVDYQKKNVVKKNKALYFYAASFNIGLEN